MSELQDPEAFLAEHADVETHTTAGARIVNLPGHRKEQRASPPPDSLLPLLWFEDIEPILDARDFVHGVLIENSAAVVYGESNTGKTFWVTDLALHVAAGKPWNGRRVDQGGVIYAAMEGGIGFKNRVAAWRRRHCVSPCEKLPFAAVPIALNLRDPEADTPLLIKTVNAAADRMGQPIKLIVVDTLSRALAGGNENAPDDMGALVRCMDRIRQETRACMLFIHHSGKDAAKGARGHSLLRAAIDTEIEIKIDDASNTMSGTVVKQRDLAKGDSFGFRLETETLGVNQHGEPVTTCVVVADDTLGGRPAKSKRLNEEAESLRREIVKLIGGEGRPIQPEHGMPEVSAIPRDRLRDRLIRVGWLQVSSAVSGAETLPNSEHQRLWKRLNTLKINGIIGYNRDYAWLVGRGGLS